MGQRLQSLRQAANMSQPDLARAANVPLATLRNWEQDRRVMRLDVAARVAKALGVTLDELAAARPGVEEEWEQAEQPVEKPEAPPAPEAAKGEVPVKKPAKKKGDAK